MQFIAKIGGDIMTGEQVDFIKFLAGQGLRPTLQYSTFTNKFFWSVALEIKEGGVLISPTEHRDTPEEALTAYIDSIRGKLLVHIGCDGERTYYHTIPLPRGDG